MTNYVRCMMHVELQFHVIDHAVQLNNASNGSSLICRGLLSKSLNWAL